jgi:uncharacterized protein involved in tolerance to divalent cations
MQSMNTKKWFDALSASMKILKWMVSNCDKVRETIKFAYDVSNEIVDQSEVAFGLATETMEDPAIRQLIVVSGQVLWAGISKKINELN